MLKKLLILFFIVLAFLLLPTTHSSSSSEWPTHGGNPANTRYSELKQIHAENVHQLGKVWTFHCGDARSDGRSQIQCQPIMIRNTLYMTSPMLKLLALDAATGKQKWVFDPFASAASQNALGVNRGVVYWEKGEDKRILFTAGSKLFAISAETGEIVPTFGEKGTVDLGVGLGREGQNLFVLSNTPGIVYKDFLILGTRVSEGPGPSAPGHIRAFDIPTGTLKWVFHTIPYPDEFGYDTWPEEAWKTSGGANSWSGFSLDEKRGWVFCPTGSPAFDFWGGDRKGKNLFGNSVLVLDAKTGERIWHYQIVHHDLWDRDLPTAPNLVTLEMNGCPIEAVAQVTKSGHVFVLNRENGSPLFPVEERPFPPSDLKGEEAWPTQPIPLKPPPFSRQQFFEEDVTNISEQSREAVLQRLRRSRTGGQFVPPSTEGTIIFPGFDGGGEWGGAAVDPQGIMYVNGNEMPWILTMVEQEQSVSQQSFGESVFLRNCVACHGLKGQGDPQRAIPPLGDVPAKHTMETLLQLLNQGKGVMPSFAFLSNREKEQVARHLLKLPEEDDAASEQKNSTRRAPKNAVSPYTHTGYNRFLDPEGYPAVKPPWGTLNAINLNTGEFVWKTVLGEFEELTKRGIPPTGTENYGGPVVTAGNVLFIGATKDEKFRAFDTRNGALLWETSLPAGGYATPCTYSVGGRQYVVIAAGGGKMGTPSGDAYVAFSLPQGIK